MLEYLLLGFPLVYFATPLLLKKERDWEGIVRAFVMGIVVALASAFVQTIPSQFIPWFYASTIRIILIAPLIEESFKFYGSFRYLEKRKAVVTIIKSMRFGYYLGFGFGFFETLVYALTGQPLFGTLLRAFLTLGMHILTASISAHGIGYAFKAGRRLYYSLLWLGIAIIIHVLFNCCAFHIQQGQTANLISYSLPKDLFVRKKV